MPISRLRKVAAFMLGCEDNAQVRVLYRWRREEDDVRILRLETFVDGRRKLATLFETGVRRWSAVVL